MDINWGAHCDVNVETLQVAEIKSYTENQSVLKYVAFLVAGLGCSKIWHIEEICLHQRYFMHSCLCACTLSVCVHVNVYVGCLESCEVAGFSHECIIQDLVMTTTYREKARLE